MPKKKQPTLWQRYKNHIAIAVTALVIVVAAHWVSGESVRVAKSYVLKELKDPSSAEFYEVKEHNGEICGYVNAKNSMGGYVGRKRFAYMPLVKHVMIETDETREIMDVKWQHSCGR